MNYIEKLQEIGINITTTGRTICPECSSERKKSNDKCLSVTFKEDGIAYHCFNCNFSGVVPYEERTRVRQIKSYTRPEKAVTKKSDLELIQYVKTRGISEDTIRKYDVQLSQNGNIVFNYYKHGELVNKKARDFAKTKFLQDKNTEQVFYGMDLIEDTNELVIVEGEFDVLAFEEGGIKAVSIPNGGNDGKLECIENCWGWLKQFETFILAVDNDVVGKILEENLVKRLGKAKCKTVDFSVYSKEDGSKVKDANDLLLVDKNALKDLIANAKFIPIDCVVTFGAVRKQILDFYHNGYSTGYSTGWKSIDKIFKIQTGRLMITTGMPTRGKSFWSDNLLFNLTKQYGWRHLILSLENNIENHFTRFASMLTEKGFKKKDHKGYFDNYISEKEVNQAIDYFDEYIYRLEIDRLWTVDDIIQEAEILVKRFGIKTLTIDPYNRLANDFKDREDRYVGQILSKLSMFAKTADIFINFIAHPKKMKERDSIPNAYDISGSADWYNMADYLLVIHRERKEGKLENRPKIIIQKVKDFCLGDPSGGTVEMNYNVVKFKIEDL